MTLGSHDGDNDHKSLTPRQLLVREALPVDAPTVREGRVVARVGGRTSRRCTGVNLWWDVGLQKRFPSRTVPTLSGTRSNKVVTEPKFAWCKGTTVGQKKKVPEIKFRYLSPSKVVHLYGRTLSSDKVLGR